MLSGGHAHNAGRRPVDMPHVVEPKPHAVFVDVNLTTVLDELAHDASRFDVVGPSLAPMGHKDGVGRKFVDELAELLSFWAIPVDAPRRDSQENGDASPKGRRSARPYTLALDVSL